MARIGFVATDTDQTAVWAEISAKLDTMNALLVEIRDKETANGNTLTAVNSKLADIDVKLGNTLNVSLI